MLQSGCKQPDWPVAGRQGSDVGVLASHHKWNLARGVELGRLS